MARSPLSRRPALRALLAAVAFAAACVGPASVAAAAETKPYIVLLEKSSAPAARVATSDIAHDEKFTPTQRYDDAVHGFAAKLDKHDLDAVRDDPRVKAVVPDRPVKAMGFVPLAPGDNAPLGVRRVGAASATTAREASSVNVAVIDTGIDLAHPDLNVAAGVSCNGTGAPTDGHGHGTHVAGTIAAKNQGGDGAVGVAPGTKVFAVRVLGANGSGYTSQIVCGIDWVTSTRTDGDPSNDIAVANMSLGGSMPPYGNCGRAVNDVEHIAICNSTAAGVTYVVAAGNSSVDEQNFAPANYPEVLTVTSMADTDGQAGGLAGANCRGEGDDQPSAFSNFATRAVDIAHTIAAPGSCIRSTYPGGQYATMSGTSMASPHVAGLVALCYGEAGAQGPCAGKTPANVLATMIGASTTAAANAPASVFNGAPSRPVGSKYYGDLASLDFPASPAAAPVNTAYPTISGSAALSATLTAANGTWTGSGNTYATQWLRCTTTSVGSCADIAGGTGSTYAPVTADVGEYLRVRVVATNANGARMMRSVSTTAVAGAVAPSNAAYPAITGTASVGATLTGTNGSWRGTAPITYAPQWLRCGDSTLGSCASIAGATTLSYTLVSADRGKLIRLLVTATNVKGSASMRSYATAAVAGPPPPINTSYPTINGATGAGSSSVGATLTASTGSWSGSPTSYRYQWLRCGDTTIGSCASVTGATSSTYTPGSTDRGKLFRIAVTATNANGSATMRSYATTIR